MADALVVRFGAVVGRDTLRRSVWPGSSPGRNVLDVHVLRLRRRLAPLGLAIRTVRSRGYLLERADQSDGLAAVRSTAGSGVAGSPALDHASRPFRRDGEPPIRLPVDVDVVAGAGDDELLEADVVGIGRPRPGRGAVGA
ncbi:MAG: helix-turn-helix domain-containing protein [Actinobacteria bacterium]|nr:helix-turn-helix domain-containing protein [Actinomycetota bacterium]